MQLLESALAFAVVMILLSTIVTGIVEMLLRLFGARQKTLRTTIESLFDTVIWPRLETRLKQQAATQKASGTDAVAADAEAGARKDFVDGMTLNPAAGGTDRLLSYQQRIDALSVMAFAERLGRTEVGQAILAEGKAAVEPIIQDFTRSFERFGRAASEVFRKNAKQVAIAVGIVVAFAANIDAGRLFTTLMENPDLRQSLIEQAEEAAEANRQEVDNLAQLLAPRETSGQAGTQTGNEQEATNDEVILAELEKLRADLATIESKGLPIGHSFYPYCDEGAAGDPSCAASTSFIERLTEREFLRWTLLTIVSGVLIGLGGPFWFRVFSSLSQVFQVLRAVGVGGKPEQAEPEKLPAAPAAEDSAKAESVLDAFKVAAQAHAETLAQNQPQDGGGNASAAPAGGASPV